MGLGNTAKKLQKVMDSAEKLYAKMNEIIGELKDLQEEVEETSRQVDHLERSVAEQRALVEAVAAQQGIDTDAVIENADLPPEPDASEDGSGETSADGTTADATSQDS